MSRELTDAPFDSRARTVAALAAYKHQLSNDLQQIEKDQDAAKSSIKRRLVQLDVAWIETADPPDPSGREERKP